LEYALKQKGSSELLEKVQQTMELANISYIRQKEQLGLGHAVLTAKELIGDEPFALFLPDDIIESKIPAMKQMLGVYDRYGSSVIAVQTIAPEESKAYGVIAPRQVEKRIYQVLSLVEKPEPEDAPSNLGIVGRYILTPEIFDMLEKTTPGKGGEIQLTDGLRLLLKKQKIYAYQFQGTRHDTGTPLGFLKASVEFALKRPDLGPRFKEYLQQLNLSN